MPNIRQRNLRANKLIDLKLDSKNDLSASITDSISQTQQIRKSAAPFYPEHTHSNSVITSSNLDSMKLDKDLQDMSITQGRHSPKNHRKVKGKKQSHQSQIVKPAKID